MPDQHASDQPEELVVDLPKLRDAFLSQSPWALLLPLGLPALAGFVMATFLRAQGKIEEDDAANVSQIIKAGAESGAKKMKIIVSRENSLGIDAVVGKVKAARPFRFTAGMRGDTQYEINVEYA